MGVRRCALQRGGAGVSARRRARRLGLPAPVVWRHVVARSLRLWLTRRGDGAHTSTSPPWRWWAPTHPVRWAAQTHAARHAEIAALLARPEVAHTQRFRFTSPRQAGTWLTGLHRRTTWERDLPDGRWLTRRTTERVRPWPI